MFLPEGLVGVGQLVGESQLGRGDFGLAAQQRDRGTDRDRVEKMQAGAQLAAELDRMNASDPEDPREA